MKDQKNKYLGDAMVVIPFRDRGTDPRRADNLATVANWWRLNGFRVRAVSDGLDDTPSAPFNRHRAYNLAVERLPEIDVFVFAEADMVIQMVQIKHALLRARQAPGLVVPFTEYRYLDDATSKLARAAWIQTREPFVPPNLGVDWLFGLKPESIMDGGKSIGAINVVSRETLNITGGFTEATSGNWYDDNIIEEGFSFLAGATRWINGPAVHLYHLPGWKGDHLTDEDRQATQRNKNLLSVMRRDIQTGDRDGVRALMQHRLDRDEH